jgi:hypothetical protein
MNTEEQHNTVTLKSQKQTNWLSSLISSFELYLVKSTI